MGATLLSLVGHATTLHDRSIDDPTMAFFSSPVLGTADLDSVRTSVWLVPGITILRSGALPHLILDTPTGRWHQRSNHSVLQSCAWGTRLVPRLIHAYCHHECLRAAQVRGSRGTVSGVPCSLPASQYHAMTQRSSRLSNVRLFRNANWLLVLLEQQLQSSSTSHAHLLNLPSPRWTLRVNLNILSLWPLPTGAAD
jgi:hypothetical protein